MNPEAVNILLVDDQPGKLLAYEAILGNLGENLITARSGHEALEHLLRTDIAVVLVDVCMPNLDGFELAKLIRQHPRCQRTAIIFISAVLLTNLDQLKGYECGAVDYVSVPVVPEILRARVMVFADLYRKTRQLEQMNRELEGRVAERTRELEIDLAERKRLEQALMEADRRKDEFLAMLAHELRNPLAPIRSALEIMGMKVVEDPEVRWCRDVIQRQSQNLTRLVDDLLDVSRITRGKIKLEKAPVEVSAVVARAVETTRPLLEAGAHVVEFQMPNGELWVDGDMTRLAQVVGNLLNNAAKYTEPGGRIRLHVERSQRGDRGEVEIRVQDSGIGIPSEMLPRVFDLFTQVDGTVDRSQGGLGIGLAIVRSIVEMHGGKTEAYSDGEGRGSEFVLRLPLLDPRRVPKPASVLAGDGGANPGFRILVVDDNQDSAAALAIVLRLCGNTVEMAHDGHDALVVAERFGPDVVLLDIGMPGLDGLEAARRIRAAPWGKKMLLVAQTGWGQDEDRRRSREAGFDAHMTKPVDHVKLMKVLASVPRWVPKASHGRAAAPMAPPVP